MCEGTQFLRNAASEIVVGEPQGNKICAIVEIIWDVSFQFIAVQPKSAQTREASQLSWDMTLESIVTEVKLMEIRQIGEERRDGALQFHAREGEREHSVHVTAATGYGTPVAEGNCGNPIGHGTIRIASYCALECQKRMSIVME